MVLQEFMFDWEAAIAGTLHLTWQNLTTDADASWCNTCFVAQLAGYLQHTLLRPAGKQNTDTVADDGNNNSSLKPSIMNGKFE